MAPGRDDGQLWVAAARWMEMGGERNQHVKLSGITTDRVMGGSEMTPR